MNDVKVIRLVADYSSHVQILDKLFEEMQFEGGVTPSLSRLVEQENKAREILNRFLSDDESGVFGFYKPGEHVSGTVSSNVVSDPSTLNMEFLNRVTNLENTFNTTVEQLSESLNYLDSKLDLTLEQLGMSGVEVPEPENLEDLETVKKVESTPSGVSQEEVFVVENSEDTDFEESTERVDSLVSGIGLPGDEPQTSELTHDGVAKPASLDANVSGAKPVKKSVEPTLSENAFAWQ